MNAPMPTALRAMRESDLDAVMDIERRAYPFPWTRSIFRDCLQAGYPGWVLEQAGQIIGYGVISIAADGRMCSTSALHRKHSRKGTAVCCCAR